jgi:hypothetical protein
MYSLSITTIIVKFYVYISLLVKPMVVWYEPLSDLWLYDIKHCQTYGCMDLAWDSTQFLFSKTLSIWPDNDYRYVMVYLECMMMHFTVSFTADFYMFVWRSIHICAILILCKIVSKRILMQSINLTNLSEKQFAFFWIKTYVCWSIFLPLWQDLFVSLSVCVICRLFFPVHLNKGIKFQIKYYKNVWWKGR